MIERQHLLILKTIAEEGTVGAAATKLCLTQSALSQAIKKLEDLSGVSIWQKNGRKVALTDGGLYLLGVANRILPQLENVDETLKQFAKGSKGNLKIGMECFPCYKWLLQVISPFYTAWPDIQVDIKKKFALGGVGALFQYEIDVLITPDPIYKKGIEFIPVLDFEQVLILPKNHHLAEKEYVCPEDLMDETLITYPIEKERLDVFSRFLTPDSIVPKRHSLIEDSEIIFQMVESNRGVAAFPNWMVDLAMKEFDIKKVKLSKKGISKKLYLGIRSNEQDREFLKGFIEIAENFR